MLLRIFLCAAFLLMYQGVAYGGLIGDGGMTRMNRERLTRQLKRHEAARGPVLKPYHCTAGVWTVGYGHNLQSHGDPVREITPEQAEIWLQEDIDDAIQAARDLFPSYGTMTDERREVLVNMAFNLGAQGLAQFHSLARHVASGEWILAATSMLGSKWAQQVGGRATELAKQMETSTAQEG